MLSAQRCLRASALTSRSSRTFLRLTRHYADLRSLRELPGRAKARLRETSSHDLLALTWPYPPRNILCVCKDDDSAVREAVVEYGHHLRNTYPDIALIFESRVAQKLAGEFPGPIYSLEASDTALCREKVDLTTTLGGDGTILHAASLFATTLNVPPVLSFSMGTLGFLGEWQFSEYKRAFREVYMSGAPSPLHPYTNDASVAATSSPSVSGDWPHTRGKTMGASRNARVLMRNRLKIGLFDSDGQRLPAEEPFEHAESEDVFALNEVLLHRGALPHLSHITILIGSPPEQKTLTTAIADGFLVSTPTGSTAYSLSSGGSIVHPLVSSILLTPICPRSLSFRPLVLPANTPITLRIEPANRAKEIEVSVDGVRRQRGLKAGMEVRVVGEEMRSPGAPGARDWVGGVPSIVRSSGPNNGDDHWVGGLNSLLKFNYPFGEDG